jgi:hypothetical protein
MHLQTPSYSWGPLQQILLVIYALFTSHPHMRPSNPSPWASVSIIPRLYLAKSPRISMLSDPVVTSQFISY